MYNKGDSESENPQECDATTFKSRKRTQISLFSTNNYLDVLPIGQTVAICNERAWKLRALRYAFLP